MGLSNVMGREKLATKVGWKAVSLEESSGFGGLTSTRQRLSRKLVRNAKTRGIGMRHKGCIDVDGACELEEGLTVGAVARVDAEVCRVRWVL
jgi:hypothetical protein